MSSEDTSPPADALDASSFSIGDRVVDREETDPNRAVVINTPGARCREWDAYYDSGGDGWVTVAEDNPDYDPDSYVIVVAFEEELEDAHPDWDPEEGPLKLANTECPHYAFPPRRLQRLDVGAQSESAGETSVDTPSDEPDVPEDAAETRSEETGAEEVTPETTPEATTDDESEPETTDEVEDEDGEETSTDDEEIPDVPGESSPTLTDEFAALRDRLSESASVETEYEDGQPVLHVSKLGTSYTIHPDGTITGDGLLRDRLEGVVDDYLASRAKST